MGEHEYLPAPSLELVEQFLVSRGWSLATEGERFNVFRPSLGSDIEGLELTLPRYGASPGTEMLLIRLAGTLAELYGLSVPQVRLATSLPNTVAAVQVNSHDIVSGSIPFAKFESLVDRLRKTLLDTAAFVVTNDSVVGAVPLSAKEYVRHCRFHQTEVGSFVAKVQLPYNVRLAPPTFFNDQGVLSDHVNAKAEAVLSHVFERVLRHPREEFSERAVLSSVSVLNLTLLQDVGSMIERVGADHLTFSFISSSRSSRIESGLLSGEARKILSEYVSYARAKLSGEVQLDMTGKVVELRSRRPDRKRNYVGVAGIWNDRPVFVAFLLSATAYQEALKAHAENVPVRVIGIAKRQKTQLRLTRVQSFEALWASDSNGGRNQVL